MAGYRIVVTTPSWSLNGVNTFTARLAEGMRARGIETDLLITMPEEADTAPMEIPACFNVTRLDTRKHRKWAERWAEVQRFIAGRGKCIYIPNYDYRHSCVAARLSAKVGVVGILHSDDPLHYDHFSRIGPEWNATVGVSRHITAKAREMNPSYPGRMTTIPYGVQIPPRMPERSAAGGQPLKIVYAGRLVTHQKRIYDLIAIMERLTEQGVRAELAMIGGGEERAEFERRAGRLIASGAIKMRGLLPNAVVMEEFERSDVFILTSDFEGLSVSLLEAMGRGCVPVVTDIESGTPELITHDKNGLLIPVGDIGEFARQLGRLAGDRETLARMQRGAYDAADTGGYRVEDMTARYEALFEQVLADAESGAFVRPGGEMHPPHYVRDVSPFQHLTWRIDAFLHRHGVRGGLWNVHGFIKHNTLGRAWWFYDWLRGRRARPW